MLLLESAEGSFWSAPPVLVEKSPLLAELVMACARDRSLTVKLVESREAYDLLVALCNQSWVFMPPDGTPIDVIAGARRLAAFLGIHEPPALTRAAALVIMDLMRACGYALDPGTCAVMSTDLEMAFPRTVSCVLATQPFREVLEMTPNIGHRTVRLVGPAQYAATVGPMVDSLKRRRQAGPGGR